MKQAVGRCDMCGSTSSRSVLTGTDHREGMPGSWDLRSCSECGLVRTDPRPTHLDAWYPTSYRQHSAEAGLTERVVASAIRQVASGRGPAPVRALLSWLIPDAELGGPLPRGSRVLDVGAGNGNALASLCAAGVDAHGLEPSADAVAAARTRGIEQIQVGTLDHRELEPGRWDLIRMAQVLEHVESPRRVLEQVRPALSATGRLALGVPNFAGTLSRVSRASWDGLELPRHLHHFTPATLRALLESTGFDVILLRTAALFGVLPATLDALTAKDHRQRGWRHNLPVRILLHPFELGAAALGGGDGIVAVARPLTR